MKTKITIHDIAKRLKITSATVSRALNDSPEISEKTKKIVRREADKLNYQRNKVATSLRSGRSNIIGVIIPSAENIFFGSVIHGISNLATTLGFDVLIYQSNELSKNEIQGVETFISSNVDGILASLAKDTQHYDHFLKAQRTGIPVVLFDRVLNNAEIPSVVIDDYRGAYMATDHLIRQGYKKIAHIAGPLNIKAFKDRLNGYKAALKAHKIKFNPAWIATSTITIDSGKEATKKLLSLATKPDAIVAVEDLTALGVLKELKLQKIKVPQQFGVFGFCNAPFSEHVTPGISSIDQRTVMMGEEAFRLIFDIITHKPKNKPTKIILDPLPVIRESSMRKDLL